MDKREYFFKAIAAGAYKRKDWLIDILGITYYDDLTAIKKYPYRLAMKRDGARIAFIPLTDGTFREEVITGSVPGQPLFTVKDPVAIDGSSGIANYTDDAALGTNYGCVLLNLILLVYPFNNKISYKNVPFNVKKVENEIINLFTDYPEEGNEKDPSKIYYDDYLKYSEAADLIRGIGYLLNPSGSRRTFTVAPEVIKLRNELYEKHKHELHNPAIISLIAQRLEKMDRESMKGDISEGFFSSGKLWSVARMKTFIMLGIEPTLSNEIATRPILSSLAEGWDLKALPEMINGQRYGSYARGKLTEFGGVVVNLMGQAFRDTSITEEDCKSESGIPIKVHRNYIKLLEGQYRVGSDEPETEASLLTHEGEIVILRSPSECKVPPPGLCAKCVGTKYSRNKRGLSLAATRQGSIFMGISMARMHGKPMITRELNLNTAFS
jgi:hypothetical protein